MDKYQKIWLIFTFFLTLMLAISIYTNLRLIDKARVLENAIEWEIKVMIESHKEINDVLESEGPKNIDEYSLFLVAKKNNVILNKIINLNRYYVELEGENSDYSKIALIYQDFEEYINFELLKRDYSIEEVGYNVDYVELESGDVKKIKMLKDLNKFLLLALENSKYVYNDASVVSFDISNFDKLLRDIESQTETYLDKEYNSNWKWSTSNSIFEVLESK